MIVIVSVSVKKPKPKTKGLGPTRAVFGAIFGRGSL